MWYWLKRVVMVVISCWLAGILFFAFLPVPFSMVMLEKQVYAWIMGDFSYVEHSDWVTINEISPYMMLAVMVVEDQKFPQHSGFDFGSIKSEVFYNQKNENRLRGASTLSQQTAKNLFLWNDRSWLRKMLEAGLTVGIELVWTKRRILTVYLNIAEFSEGIFGVEAAAHHFFHRSTSQLTASEAALLAAVLPNPYRFKVNESSGYVIQRQQWILRQMQQLGGIDFLQENRLK